MTKARKHVKLNVYDIDANTSINLEIGAIPNHVEMTLRYFVCMFQTESPYLKIHQKIVPNAVHETPFF